MTEIAILSGKGGTGKSSLCSAFATIDQNMIIADCDVDAANMHIILQPLNYLEKSFLTGYKATIDNNSCNSCGLCIDLCRFNAIVKENEKVTVSEIACDGCKLCSRICPSNSITMVPNNNSHWYIGDYRNGKIIHARLSPGEENSGKLVNVVRENARLTSKETNWQTIVIDGPPGTGCSAIASITGVNKVIVVSEPSKSGVHDMKRIFELIFKYNIEPFVVINKYDLNEEITREIEEWCIGHNICIAGKIAFDRKMVEAMVNCKSILEWAPDCDNSKIIKNIWKRINK